MSVQEFPAEAWVSGGLLQGQGQTVAVSAWDLLKEPSSSLPPPQLGLRSDKREGTQPCPSIENWIKDLLNMRRREQQGSMASLTRWT